MGENQWKTPYLILSSSGYGILSFLQLLVACPYFVVVTISKARLIFRVLAMSTRMKK